ncbi:Bbp19 family protein [Acinetobacter oleivorans]|uniref:Bbp19 family protein n=1 Tax=Acinetobacter oleivorans TaxID=1148157 RepID=UPI00124FB5BF|nr:hypothetical protein [Acinetobacter oleivorans]
MIIGIAVLLILLFIASVALFVQRRGLVILEEKYWDENRLHLDTKTRLERDLEAYKLKLKQSNDELNLYMNSCQRRARERDEARDDLAKAQSLILELSNPQPKEEAKEESEEIGNFVRTKRMKRATPETYRNVFDLDVNGQRVLEHLTMVFCKDPFVADDKGGERQTSYNLGAQGVINFIVNNINQANQPNYKEQDND